MQNSKIPIKKWLELFWLVIELDEFSATKIAQKVSINRKTASKLRRLILEEYAKNKSFRELVMRINDERRTG